MAYSHQHKLARALEHLKAYNLLAEKWIQLHAKTSPFRIESQPSNYGISYIVYFEPIEEFPEIALGLHVGDFLHNLRSALDHLIFELATAYTVPLLIDAAEKCEFPVFWKRPMNASDERSKIGCIHPDAVKLIKRMQPHHKGIEYEHDPLWILNELERIDKHRTLHIASHQLTKNDISGSNINVRSFAGMTTAEGVAKGAKLAEFSVERIDSKQPVHVDYRPSTTITLEPGLPLSGKPLGSSLHKMYDEIYRTVVVPLERFL